MKITTIYQLLKNSLLQFLISGEQLNECWPLKLSTVCKQLSLQCINSKQCASNEICCRHECGTTCLATELIGPIDDVR